MVLQLFFDSGKTIFLEIEGKKIMRILSLDMSTKKTGWAIFDNDKLEVYDLIEENDKDISMRIMNMYVRIQELITSKKIDCVVCEDVPVSQHSNLEVGKNLCILQGCILALVSMYNLKFYRLKPTEWRSKIGVNRTLYTCKKCGLEMENNSNLNNLVCMCGNSNKTGFNKKELNDRYALKERAVKMANEIFNLNGKLNFISKSSKKNDDDIAEALLIGYCFIKNGEV